jgi:fused signal recognition particle receptor
MQKLIKNLNFIISKFKKNNEEFWPEIEEQMILNDISALTSGEIIEKLKNKAKNENIRDADSMKLLLRDEIIKILAGDDFPVSDKKAINLSSLPSVWMIAGVNGVGKTSTIAKLANYFKNQGKSIILTAADTFRAAAFEQIDHFANILEIPVVHHQRYSDPGAVVFDSLEKAAAKNTDIVLIDTAGRMHTSYNLMEELKKIKKIIIKNTGKPPDEVLMVLDSTTGQNAKNQVKIFHDALDLTGLILTKTDGTSKGGMVITIRNEIDIPVKFITFGEKLDNIEIFDPVKFTDSLLN